MLYLTQKWDSLDIEGLSGGLQIISQGRTSPGIVLSFAKNETLNCWEYEIFRCPPQTSLADLTEDPDRIWNARSNQRAIELVNSEHDCSSADILSDLSNGGIAGSPQSKVLFKGKAPITWEAAKLQRFLQETVKEILKETAWEPKHKIARAGR